MKCRGVRPSKVLFERIEERSINGLGNRGYANSVITRTSNHAEFRPRTEFLQTFLFLSRDSLFFTQFRQGNSKHSGTPAQDSGKFTATPTR